MGAHTTPDEGKAMAVVGTEDGLRLVIDADVDAAEDAEGAEAIEDGRERFEAPDEDLESLRDAFVDAFNARDLDEILTLVSRDVECPDIAGDGRPVLAEELESIWERSPGAFLTRAFLDSAPCAVAWMPDEDGCWVRAALVTLASDEGLISVVALPDDIDALERAEADDPTGEELEEWSDWTEWDRGEETVARERN